MSTLAIKDGEVREVTRSRLDTARVPGMRWCPFCDHSSQLNRASCAGCHAVFEDNIELTPEALAVAVENTFPGVESVVPASDSKCTCVHEFFHHNNDGQCRYRQYCHCEEFTLAPPEEVPVPTVPE